MKTCKKIILIMTALLLFIVNGNCETALAEMTKGAASLTVKSLKVKETNDVISVNLEASLENSSSLFDVYAKIAIINARGVKVKTFTKYITGELGSESYVKNIEIDVSKLPKGDYVLIAELLSEEVIANTDSASVTFSKRNSNTTKLVIKSIDITQEIDIVEVIMEVESNSNSIYGVYMNIAIINARGVKVKTFTKYITGELGSKSYSKNIEIDVSKLPKGDYVLTAELLSEEEDVVSDNAKVTFSKK